MIELQDIEEVIENNLDRTKWQKWKFSDLVENIVEKVVPKKSGLEHYIGLEHLDTGSLKIRRFGETASLIGDKLRIYKGDFIFAKRNAYLKRVAIAEFDAVASAHSMVLRAKPVNVLPEFLPFFLLSETFWERAIEISVGSLSPTINWKAIAKQEFLLPPKDQQAKLAELLWAMDEVIESELELLARLEKSLESKIEDEIHGIKLYGKTIQEAIDELLCNNKVVQLSKLGKVLKGKGIAKSEVVNEGIPCIRYGELYTKHYRIIRDYYSFITPETAKTGFKLQMNDVVLAGSGETITEIGRSAAFIDNVLAYAGSDTLIFRPENMDGTYLGYLMNSQLVRQQLNKYGTGATVMHIYALDINKIIVPKITKDKQIEIGRVLENLARNIMNIESKIASSKALQKSLINQIF
ncbi:restriction endonuclease subunit S [Bacteroidota bacterium]